MDIRLPSGEVVAPAEQCAGEQAWYSDSGKVKHHEGISTFSMGALIVAEKLDSTKVLSSISWSPRLCSQSIKGSYCSSPADRSDRNTLVLCLPRTIPEFQESF
jgi:hypothetical protein